MYNINPIYDDVRLYFNEAEHKYTDTFNNQYISTTTLLHNCAPTFDKKYWLKKKAKELGISEKRLENNGKILQMKLVLEGLKLIMDLKMVLKQLLCFMMQFNIFLEKIIL